MRTPLPDRAARRLTWALLALGAAGACAYALSSSALVDAVAYGGAGVLALGAGLVALRRRFGGRAHGRSLLLVAAAAWLAGDTLWTLLLKIGGSTPFPSPADAIYIAGYPVALAGIVVLWRRRTTGTLGGLLDACIFATAVGLFLWATAVDAPRSGAAPVELAIATAYPTLDVLVLVALAQLFAVAPLRRNRAVQGLVAGAAAFLASDLFYAHGAVRGTYVDGTWQDVGWLACYVLWGAAAVHPDARALATGPKRHVRMTTQRLAVLAAACLFAPAGLVLAAPLGPADLVAFAASGSLLIVFVFWRMTLIFREERRAADELRRSREVYRALVDESGDMIALVAADGRIAFASPAHADVLGRDAEGLVGADYDALVHPDDRTTVAAARRAVLAGGRPAIPPFRLVRADGQVVWAEMTATALDPGTYGNPLVLTSTREVTERHRAQTELAETTRKLQTLVDSAPVGIVAVDLDGTVGIWNPEAERMFGWTAAEVVGRQTPLLTERMRRRMIERLLAGETLEEEGVRPHRDGRDVPVIVHVVLLRDARGEPAGAFAVFVDTAERRALEERLRQSQKMEAIGQLAGGIAHDFNNLLTGIAGYTELALARAGADERLRHDLAEVARAADRAAGLTRQLLAFGRRQMLRATVFDLNEAVVATTGLLGRVLGEHIRIVTSLDPAGCPVLADQSQLEQVLMNLAVNARDAQPDGGTLALETGSVTLAAPAAGRDLPAGEYVRLRVSDTGHGMDAETAGRAFEPFFTTKDVGQGTGLGLATVYGIVTQSGGSIALETEPGAGTTFEILLPRTSRPAEARASSPGAAPGGSERILLVEDEAVVRALTRELLEAGGYAVAEAAGPQEALELAAREPVDLVLTDVVMPGMSGNRLAEAIREDRPDVPVVFTSGYPDDAALRVGSLASGAGFLAKPYSGAELLRAVRAGLDGRGQTRSRSSSSAATTS